MKKGEALMLEMELHIARCADNYRSKYPEKAKRLEEEAVKAFEEHYYDTRMLNLRQAYNVFPLTVALKDEKARFAANDNDLYICMEGTAGLFGNKASYRLMAEDSQYVVIDAILRYAENHYIPASYSWVSLSPKAIKAYGRELGNDPMWSALLFEWSAVKLGKKFVAPKDHLVWFGIFYDATRY